MAIKSEDKDKIRLLIAKASKQGYITHDEILDCFPEIEDNLPLLDVILDTLQDAQIEVIEPLSHDNLDYITAAGSSKKQSNLSFEEKIQILKQIKSQVSTEPMRAYLYEIGKVPLLNAEEETILAKRIEDSDKEFIRIISELGSQQNAKLVYKKAFDVIQTGVFKDPLIDEAKKRIVEHDKMYINSTIKLGIEARTVLINANLRLVVSIAKGYAKRELNILDLIQEGNLGLMRAVDKFEYKKGFKFSTYATWWIRQAITRALADQGRTIRIPVHMIETINKLSRVSSILSTELGRKPTHAEIAERMDLPVDKVHEIIKIAQKPQSLESPLTEDSDGGTSLSEVIHDEFTSSPQDIATWSYLKKQINQVLSGLSERERKVLELRFGLKDGVARTLEEVGHEFNVTRERIRQIEAKALRRMKNDSFVQALKDYLD